MVNFNRKNRNLDENGFASITIALVLIAVLGLLTVGFAQLARREQQNALDKQLANQAYYAAESGVNDANNAIKAGSLTTSTPKEGTEQCMDLPLPGAPDALISKQTGVSYSCVMVDLQPKTLTKNMASDGDWTTYFTPVDSSPDTITLQWSSMIASKQPHSAGTSLDQTTVWGSLALMQFSITPLGSYSRNDLINNTFTVYGYPSTSSGSVAYSDHLSDQGQIVSAACSPAPNSTCHVTITGLPLSATKYAVHIHDYYDASHVALSAKRSGTALRMADSQAAIDVTGKAQDVLKRILVHVPIHPSHDLPDSALEAQDICKYFTTDPLDNTKIGSPLPSDTGITSDMTNTCTVGD